MELFIKVLFWMYAIQIGLSSLSLLFCKYPREIKRSAGFEFFGVLLSAAMLIWAGKLVMGW